MRIGQTGAFAHVAKGRNDAGDGLGFFIVFFFAAVVFRRLVRRRFDDAPLLRRGLRRVRVLVRLARTRVLRVRVRLFLLVRVLVRVFRPRLGRARATSSRVPARDSPWTPRRSSRSGPSPEASTRSTYFATAAFVASSSRALASSPRSVSISRLACFMVSVATWARKWSRRAYTARFSASGATGIATDEDIASSRERSELGNAFRAARRLDVRVRRGGVSGAANRRPVCARACDDGRHTRSWVLKSVVCLSRGCQRLDSRESVNRKGAHSELGSIRRKCRRRRGIVIVARAGRHLYDAFAARVTARGDGLGPTNASPRATTGERTRHRPRRATPRASRPCRCPTYVSLHRSGLWFVNPFWHRAWSLPAVRTGEGVRNHETVRRRRAFTERFDDKDKRTSGNGNGNGSECAVIVPVAVRVGRVSHATLRRLSFLGDAWRRESFSFRDEEDRKVSPKEKEEEEKEKEDLFRGDAVCEIGVSLCVVDGDGTAVVLRVSSGLVEPEDVDPPAGDAVDLLADDFLDAGDGGLKGVGFSDDEEEDEDERDAGEVGGAERETRDGTHPDPNGF